MCPFRSPTSCVSGRNPLIPKPFLATGRGFFIALICWRKNKVCAAALACLWKSSVSMLINLLCKGDQQLSLSLEFQVSLWLLSCLLLTLLIIDISYWKKGILWLGVSPPPPDANPACSSLCAQVRERDLPMVMHTLSSEFTLLRVVNGETVAAHNLGVSNGFVKPKLGTTTSEDTVSYNLKWTAA